MFKFTAALLKEFRLLVRDRVGLALMFLMPILLVIIMTAIQNSTFELINDNKIPILLFNNDNSATSKDFVRTLEKAGMFKVIQINFKEKQNIRALMHKHDALVALTIPKAYFSQMEKQAQINAAKALESFGMANASGVKTNISLDSLDISFQPVLQESYRYSIRGGLQSIMQIIANKIMIKSLYSSINQKEMPDDFLKDMMKSQVTFKQTTLSNNDNATIPNASQHNVPAWTLFAMFFTVVSLGGNMVKEKLSGSFVRLKLLPTSYMLGLLAKQLVYLGVIIAQVIVIFSIGKWVFPCMHLPELNMPTNLFSLLFVVLVCGWNAISFALCIGVFAQSQEQASGFGSVSVVILAAFGGVFVPAFAMPEAFTLIMKASPFYWGLESFYGLFLENRMFIDILGTMLPLIIIAILLQITAFIGLKAQKLVH